MLRVIGLSRSGRGEQSRAHAVDGAQIRLATLAMNLGLAKEKLATQDVDQVAELVDAAHRGAKDALAELRDLVRGIHPPVPDNGLADALASLASTVDGRLDVDSPPGGPTRITVYLPLRA